VNRYRQGGDPRGDGLPSPGSLGTLCPHQAFQRSRPSGGTVVRSRRGRCGIGGPISRRLGPREPHSLSGRGGWDPAGSLNFEKDIAPPRSVGPYRPPVPPWRSVSALGQGIRFELLPLKDLAPHERVIPGRVEALLHAITAAGRVYKPIIVDEETLTVIDGHHRLHALKLMGARKAPVLLVDYERDANKISPAPKPVTGGLLNILTRSPGPAQAIVSDGHTRVIHVDPLDAYKALARAPPLAPPTPHALMLTPPPPEPWIIRELAARRLLLPPRTTVHQTWAKRVVLGVPLNILL